MALTPAQYRKKSAALRTECIEAIAKARLDYKDKIKKLNAQKA